MRKNLIRKLDIEFSKFIRLRDSKKFDYQMFVCISCGKLKKFEQADCGHFVSRRHYATRWNEQNCNAQCRYCNRFREGEQMMYAKGLNKKYGKGTAERLQITKNKRLKITDMDLQFWIAHYKQLNKELQIKMSN